MEEVLRNPAQKEPQGPAVAEVDNRDRRHAAKQGFPRDVGGLRLGLRQYLELVSRDARMIFRMLRKSDCPDNHPHQAEHAADVERFAPAPGGHHEDDCGRRHRIADARGRVRNALREAALLFGHPARHRGCRRRKRRPLTEAQQQPCGEQRSEPAGKAGQDGGQRPNCAAADQGALGAETVAHPAADDLKHEVRIREGRKDQANLSMRKLELLTEAGCCGTDVDAVKVGNEVHDA